MKLPLLNRKRYIVLKCYTWHRGVFEKAPITIGSQEKIKPPKSENYLSTKTSYATCWSRLETNKRSATIPAPSTFRYMCSKDGIVDFAGSGNVIQSDFKHNDDPTYGLSKDFVISKLFMPWHLEESSGVNFIFARHIHNKTMMNVLSGVHSFKPTCQINVFNAVNKVEHQYEVPFLTPMVSMYAMSDLPLHVENYHDKDKFQELEQKVYNPHFRAGGIKNTKGIVNG